jgi:type II secretory pathway component GspD/PulD (secretin)
MVACTPIMTSKKDALEKIQADSKDSTEIFNSNLAPTAPKVDIIQINYGADSLKNIDFLSFLAGAKVKLSSVIIENLKTQENQYLNALKKEKSPQVFLTEAIAAAKITADKDIQLAKKLNTTMTLNLSGINLSQVLEQIAKRGKIEIKSNFNGPSPQLQGVYKGTVGSVLKTIAEENKLLVYKSANLEDTLEIYSTANNTLMLMNFDSVNSTLDVKKDLIILNQKYLEIFPNDGAQSNISDQQLDVSAELKTQSVTLFLEGLINQIQISMIEKERNKALSDVRKVLIKESTTSKDDTENFKIANAVYKPTIKEGEELIIEKFSVYNQSPEDLKKIITGYSIFSKGNCAVIEAKPAVTLTTLATAPATPAAATPAPATPAAATPAPATPAAATPTPATPTPATPAPAVTESATCVKLTLDTDATGIIASGSINDIKLVEKLIDEQDSAVKQALLEVYILEVNSGWASSLEGIGRRTTNGAAGTGGTAGSPATTILRGAQTASISGGLSIATALGAKNDIVALINMLETNSLGKTISKPSIIVKDGGTGVVNKQRTVQTTDSTTTVSNGISTIATTIRPISSPLVVNLTPKINKHNDNIDLAFDFNQTTRDSDLATAPTSTNSIKTSLLIEPGKVVVLAGLKIETESASSDALPFLAKAGLQPIFGPLIALLGGKQAFTKTSTELLVIINPTVITTRNIARTFDKAIK